MGFRFRRSVRIFPGLRFNLSKSGVSTSIGKRGAIINIGADRVRTTVGVPGTGVSYSNSTRRRIGGGTLVLIILFLIAVVSVLS